MPRAHAGGGHQAERADDKGVWRQQRLVYFAPGLADAAAQPRRASTAAMAGIHGACGSELAPYGNTVSSFRIPQEENMGLERKAAAKVSLWRQRGGAAGDMACQWG